MPIRFAFHKLHSWLQITELLSKDKDQLEVAAVTQKSSDVGLDKVVGMGTLGGGCT